MDDFRGTTPPVPAESTPPLPPPPILPNIASSIDLDMVDTVEIDSPTPTRPTRTTRTSSIFDFSSDPLNSTDFEPQFRQNGLSASTHRPTNLPSNPSRKRTFDLPSTQPTKEPRLQEPISSSIRNTILEARDLIIKAYTLSQSRDEQSKLLDLVEVFREFTELGRIRHTTSILATQIANLEQTSRKIDIQARQIQEKPKKPKSTTWAKVAAKSAIPPAALTSTTTIQPARNATSTLPETQNWTTVLSKTKKGSRAGISSNTTNSSSREKSRERSKLALSRRCTLL